MLLFTDSHIFNMWRIKFIVVVSIFFFAGCTHTTKEYDANSNCNNDLAINFAQQFYSYHRYFFAEPKPDSITVLYTPEFAKVIKEHARCVKHNGICNIDFDPWTFSQDGSIDGKINYTTREEKGGFLTVDLSYLFRVHPDFEGIHQVASLKLVKSTLPQCWRLNDMIMPNGESIKRMMVQDYQYFKSKKMYR